MAGNNIVLLGCGDVGPIHEPMENYGTLARSTLAAADIRFAQVERVYSERGAQQLHAGVGHSRVRPSMISVFSDCGFNVVSLASNHAMDWGVDALLDTLDNFRKRDIQTIGAGANIDEARRPAIVERNGVKVAILAYCSILNEGYAATAHRAGVAPLRVHTYYRPLESQPGIPPKVVTVPYEDDLAAMLEDIAKAKQNNHAVVVSLHWGIHHIPKMIADYQPLVAEAVFKAGADLILGHHAHLPKAIGVHQGKVCFYSLSNFIMSASEKTPAQVAAFTKRYGSSPDPEYPRLPYASDGKRSLIVKALLSREGAARVSFLPVLIDKQLRPEVLRSRDSRFEDALRYMEWVSDEFAHRFTVSGDEVVVTA
jgi:poly-gamma-glutamate capsule biosynthesis protein CapA/YwtB (metallophosphatase superfamily)